MSNQEITRLEVMQRLRDKRLKQFEAARMLGISVRQVKRVFRAFKAYGAVGLMSRRRGRPSNHRLDPGTMQTAIDLIYERYQDFGPTLAHEKLTEVHGLKLSDERVHRLMIIEGLWKPKCAKKSPVHPMQERQACFG
jgi:hypothetical protein